MSNWHYQSAHDLGLSGQERHCCVQRETSLLDSGLRLLWQVYVRVVLKTWNRMEIRGMENLPAQPPFVLVANHTSHLDAIVLSSVLPWAWRNHVSPLAAGDYFFSSLAMSEFSAGVLNALPIWRERQRGQRHELADLRERLINQSAIYIVFPEGTRSRDGELHTFKPGFATLVAGTNIPIVPCHLDGNGTAFPPNKFFLRPHKITLRIGKPMVFDSVPNHAPGWREIARVVQEVTEHLHSRCAREKRRRQSPFRTVPSTVEKLKRFARCVEAGLTGRKPV